MNAKEVLGKIMTLLSYDNKDMNFTDARDAQGNILQSPTFDLGEKVDVVGEDGSLTPAPDGEHEIELKDSEGNRVVIKIETEGGIIKERENVEEADPADLEKVNEEVVDKEAEEVKMADAETKPVNELPNTTAESPENIVDEEPAGDSPIISELKAKIKELELELESYKMAEDTMIEDELPKLDGAPIEENMKKFSALKGNQNKNTIADPQNTFLSKLYK
jgi:hypothetical protein